MSTQTKPSFFVILLALGTLSLATACGETREKQTREPLKLELDPAPISRDGTLGPRSHAPMLEEARKAVVSVHTAEVVRVARGSGGAGSREDEFLRRFFGLPAPNRGAAPQVEERRVPQGVGSGVIVREDGYIITNSHVISDQRGEEADEVLVRLTDGRELPARIVGRDTRTDIAVLKVEATGLPTLKIADSAQIMVGDIVFAIGNPMGIGLTVTSGIVSATGRAIGIYGREGYENFIQTDAAINVGNSGGALVDIEGRLIGINSAIVSRSGGNIGIGFAIPTSLAVHITDQLTGSGEVRRGLLGVSIDNLSPDMAEAFGLENAKGALISEVLPGLPAEKAGLKRGDVITALNGKPVESSNMLRIRVSKHAPGSEVKVTVLRDGKEKVFPVTLGDQSNQLGSTGDELLEGVSAASLDEKLRRDFGIPKRLNGIVITKVAPDSIYARKLVPGLVLIEINDEAVEDLDEARAALRKGVNKVYLYSEGRTGYVAVRVP